MKCILLPLFLLCIFTNAFAQKDTMSQYLSISRKYDKYEMSPHYYRVGKKNGNLWTVKEYYVKQKSMSMEGSYLDDSLTLAHGSFVWFHENKSLKQSGRYLYGKKDGLWKEYYDNGKLMDSAYFKNDIPVYVAFHYDTTGSLIAKGVYDKEGKGTGYEWMYNSDKSVMCCGKYSEGYVKDSIWEYHDENGIVSMREYYDKGERVKAECFDLQGNLEATDCKLEKLPAFPGTINQYLANNMRYPKELRNNNWMGTVLTQFVVNKDGSITNVKVLTNSPDAANKEVERVIKAMPNWDPGMQANRIVPVYFTLPMRYKLE